MKNQWNSNPRNLIVIRETFPIRNIELTERRNYWVIQGNFTLATEGHYIYSCHNIVCRTTCIYHSLRVIGRTKCSQSKLQPPGSSWLPTTSISLTISPPWYCVQNNFFMTSISLQKLLVAFTSSFRYCVFVENDLNEIWTTKIAFVYSNCNVSLR